MKYQAYLLYSLEGYLLYSLKKWIYTVGGITYSAIIIKYDVSLILPLL